MKSIISIIGLLVLTQWLWGQEKPFIVELNSSNDSVTTPTSIFQYLSNDKINTLIITTDVRKLLEGKQVEDPEYQEAKLTFIDQNEISQEWPIKVRVRGYRRKQVCTLPPVKLDFKKPQLDSLGLNPEYDNLKVVNDCNKGAKCDVYLLREYLIYKIYNILTDRSFRVKLLTIKYIDTKGHRDFDEQFAFILENTSEMAKRLGGVEYEIPLFQYQAIKNETTALLDLFQYMIGNTDYKIKVFHNIKVVRISEQTEMFPVPYDFDYSGLVNTYYAMPAIGLTTEKVTERVFLGLCTDDDIWEQTFHRFLEKEEEIMLLVDNFEYLRKGDKRHVKSYLKSFYKELKKRKPIQRAIKQSCIEYE